MSDNEQADETIAAFKALENKDCPQCGRCPTCGRGPVDSLPPWQRQPYVPWQPYQPTLPWPWTPYATPLTSDGTASPVGARFGEPTMLAI